MHRIINLSLSSRARSFSDFERDSLFYDNDTDDDDGKWTRLFNGKKFQATHGLQNNMGVSDMVVFRVDDECRVFIQIRTRAGFRKFR